MNEDEARRKQIKLEDLAALKRLKNDVVSEAYPELMERICMLNDIALSAICLKLNIEHGFPPRLDALNRDLGAFQLRFGGVVEMAGKAALEMDRCLCVEGCSVNGECPVHGDAVEAEWQKRWGQ